jgi:hypothetical protein
MRFPISTYITLLRCCQVCRPSTYRLYIEKGCGDEYGVVNVKIGGTVLTRFVYELRGHFLPVDLDLLRDRKECVQLLRYRCGFVVPADCLYEIRVSTIQMACGGAVACLAEVAGVFRRHESGDQLAIP